MQAPNLLLLAISQLITATTALHFNHSSYLIPHPEKVSKGGEDAYFASKSLLVVADGVGGWNNQGVDPSLYSRFLCSAYLQYDPVLKYTSMKILFTIRGTPNCRLFVLRNYEQYRLIFETVDQLHGFNFPYQLAQEEYAGDNPKEAICSTLTVRAGDLVVLASDGMADNIFDFEVVRMAQQMKNTNAIDQLAKLLAKKAVERAKKKTGLSPFGVKAKEWGIDFEGGKVDDTTVIVAEIVAAPSKGKSAQDL